MTLVPTPRLLWLVFYAALVAVGAGPLPELEQRFSDACRQIPGGASS